MIDKMKVYKDTEISNKAVLVYSFDENNSKRFEFIFEYS